MSFQTLEYSPDQVVFIFAGIIAQGVSEDGGIQFSRNADMYSLATAINGQPTRIRNNNFSGRFTVNLQQSSPTNADYSALATADEINGQGKGAIFLRDNSGTTLVTAVTGWIVKRPDISFTNSLQDRQWVIETGYATVVNGGSFYV